MSHDTLKATLLQLALPAVRAQGLDIWGLELIEGRQMIVRLFVEAATGNTETDMMNGAEGGSQGTAFGHRRSVRSHFPPVLPCSGRRRRH